MENRSRYTPQNSPAHVRSTGRTARRQWEWGISLAVLVTVDGVLIYMIAVCMIQPGIGAGLVALVSGYIGYYL